MNKTFVTIVALSVDNRTATLYLQDGTTLTMKQGDSRLPNIAAVAKEAFGKGLKSVEVDVTVPVAENTEYADAERGTKGAVKFFRVAKSLLKKLLNTESPQEVPEEVAYVSPLDIGTFPGKEVEPAQFTAEVSAQLLEMIKGQGNWQVILTGNNSNSLQKVAAIKLVRTVSNLGLKEAKDLLEKNVPAVILTGYDEPTAFVICHWLQEFGYMAKINFEEVVSLEPWGPTAEEQLAEPVQETKAEPTNDEKLDAAGERMRMLMDSGKQTSDPEFHKPLDESVETIVAVHQSSGMVVPDAHKLSRQLRASAKLQDYAGFEKFLERLSLIINDRAHSVEDLMKFIEKGDLPIADDGCIVIYKRLNRQVNGVMTDVHSGRIKQKVGSYVFMRAGLVDPNRRQDCSNGLHVASLSYLGGFSGNETVIAKVRPEDVFAVPEYNTNKMRVCGYHILGILPENLRNLVNGGGSISSVPEGAMLLGSVLRGQHIGITQHVEIGGQKGTSVTYTDVAVGSADDLVVTAATAPRAETLDLAEELQAKVPVAPDVMPDELVDKPVDKVKRSTPVNRKATGTKKKGAKSKPAKVAKRAVGKTLVFATAYDAVVSAKTSDVANEAAKKLLQMKSAARKGWDKLGFSNEEVEIVMKSVSKTTNAKAEGILETRAKAEKRKDSGKANPNSPAGLIRGMLEKGNLSVDEYKAVVLLKRKAKKGWQALGVSEAEQAEIEKHTK